MQEKPKYEPVPSGVLAINSQIDSMNHAIPSLDLAREIQMVNLVNRIVGWPENFPPSCPPSEAGPDEFDAFRLVSNSPPVRQDFVSHVDSNKYFPPTELCRACGLSVYRDINDAKAVRLKFKPLKNMMIARVHIALRDGVVMQTSTPALMATQIPPLVATSNSPTLSAVR